MGLAMNLRKLRKKTRPTQKKEVLFPCENRLEALEALEKAVQQYNELLKMHKFVVDMKIDENDPTLIHFTGIPKAPVERIVVECTISNQEGEH